jgi:hypothetical protein
MTHIICRAAFCLFWDDGVCISDEITYEPDVGCLTLQDWEDDSDDSLLDDDDDDWDADDDDGDWEDDL